MAHVAPVGTLCAGDVRVLETHHPPGYRLSQHAHATASLTCVMRGDFEEVFHSSTVECRARSLLFKPAGEVHEDRYGSEGADCLQIELPESRLRGLGSQAAFSTVSYIANGTVAALIGVLASEVRSADELSPLAVEGLVLELLVQVGRKANPPRLGACTPWLPSILGYLDTHFREPLILGDVAARAGIDPSHLAKVFRAHAGVTPREYLRLRRVDWARSQLLRSRDSLAEIALAAGFSDQSHFTRIFSRMTGVSPGLYRRTATPSHLDSVQRSN